MIAIFDNIRSAQNVGSMVRTCDALGIREVFLCGITPNQNNEKVKKTSLGAEKNIRFKSYGTTEEAIFYLKSKNYHIFALETGNHVKDISIFKPSSPFAILVGNEVLGVSDNVLNLVDDTVEIPMVGKKESLNVAVAFGIAAYILSR